ncbi:hypothetical protein GCM10009768_17830 [Leucobacter iarius]|uniref:Uncharacterized protein n=1 Tax=Leucobacter iarius TaxID=333963 RepID=A0ABP4XUT2_9MICO
MMALCTAPIPAFMASGFTRVAVTNATTTTAVGQNTQRAIPDRDPLESGVDVGCCSEDMLRR